MFILIAFNTEAAFQTNVVMSSTGVPMLTDFGQSRALYYTQSSLVSSAHDNLKGSSHWVAYELLGFLDTPEAQVICTKPSDMWAFGMVVFVSAFAHASLVLKSNFLQEIISGTLPYAHIGGPYAELKIMHAIRRKILPGEPADISEEKNKLYHKVCTSCWEFDPLRRPTACDIVNTLEEKVRKRAVQEGCFSWISKVASSFFWLSTLLDSLRYYADMYSFF